MSTIEFKCNISRRHLVLRAFNGAFVADGNDSPDPAQDTISKALMRKAGISEGGDLKGWFHTIMGDTFMIRSRHCGLPGNGVPLSTACTSSKSATRLDSAARRDFPGTTASGHLSACLRLCASTGNSAAKYSH